MLMIRGGSKLLAPTIEDRILENLNVKEAYIFPVPESDIDLPVTEESMDSRIEISREEIDDGILYQIPGLAYFGDISVDDIKEYNDLNLPPYHRPISIYRLSNTLSTFTEAEVWKVRRLSMHDTLKENYKEWCIEWEHNLK